MTDIENTPHAKEIPMPALVHIHHICNEDYIDMQQNQASGQFSCQVENLSGVIQISQ